MDDMISRQAATSLPVMPKEHRNYQTYNLDDVYEEGWNDALECVNGLPSVQPKTVCVAKVTLSDDQIHEAVEKAKAEIAQSMLTVIEPERKTGRWSIKAINTFSLAYGTTGYEPIYECSECGLVTESYLRLDEPIMPEDADFPKFCPNCGAKMEVEKDETD